MVRISSYRKLGSSTPIVATQDSEMPTAAESKAQQSSSGMSLIAAALSAPSYTTVIPDRDTYTESRNGSFHIQGLGGNDTVTVGSTTTGNDYLDGGIGNDTLNAAATNDFLDGGAGTDTLNAGAGNDILRGGSGADNLNGGDGIDTADYSNSTAGVTVTLPVDPARTARGAGGDATGDVLSSIENFIGSALKDALSGNRLNNQLVGNAGDDTLRGLDGNDVLIGDAMVDVNQDGIPDDENGDGVPDGVDENAFGGADLIDGGNGDDKIYGGGGNDTLIGGFGNDTIHGGFGNDFITAGDGDDVVDGGEGDDEIIGSLGNDTLRGGGGSDWLNASLGADLLDGGDGDDELISGEGTDTLIGGKGNDTLIAGAGDDMLDGGEGDDILEGDGGADQMNGGDGIDTADYSAGGPVAIDLLNGLYGGAATGDVLTNIENLKGSAGDDVLGGDGNDNVLTGGAGADRLVGQGGFDTADYSGSAAGVTVQLNSTQAAPAAAGSGLGGDAEGDELLLIERVVGSAFADVLRGGELGDTLMGGASADTIDGGAGTDTAEYSSSGAAVSIALDETGGATGAGGDAQGDTLIAIENLTGSAFDDTLHGNAAANRLTGGAGNDRLRGGAGADRLSGGSGVDTADYSTSGAGVTVGLVVSDNPDAVTTGSGGDAAGDQLSEIENIVGSAFNDVLLGSVANNRLEGGDGNDQLRGDAGADVLIGGNGIDLALYTNSDAGVTVTLFDNGTGTGSGGHAQGDQLNTIENLIGSAFNDILIGNSGANQLQGGAGDDFFRGGAGADIMIGGAGFDTADYSTSTAGVIARLNVGLSGSGSTGADAQGDGLLEMEAVIGSNFTDTLIGSSVANKLVSGSGADTLVGGLGNDLLVANGTGSKVLYGDGVSGTPGVDTFRVLGGTNNLIRDYQLGEELQFNSLNSSGGIALTRIMVDDAVHWAARFTGNTHLTFVDLHAFVDPAASTQVQQQQAAAALNFIINNDLVVDPGLIA